jgi:hypothetical protein
MMHACHDRDVDDEGWNQGGFRYERRMNAPKIPDLSDVFAKPAPAALRTDEAALAWELR